MKQTKSQMSLVEAIALGAVVARDGGTMATLGMLVPVSKITDKPVPRWPDRRSYRAHQRDAAKRLNIAKGGRR